MPQDKTRSIKYRSFVTCDDPKSVVECGAIGKAKTHKREQQSIIKVEFDRKQGNQNTSLAVIKEQREKKTFQLLEVSKGADKLNHVMNSWSNSEGNHKGMAKDLLRGALDLKESLLMLGKLQETSSCMSGLSRKHKQKLKEGLGMFDSMVSEVREFHRSRLSADGYSRKSFDEVKKVVSDSLVAQNFITNPVFEEHYDHRKMGSPDMMPCTSSSSSSMVYSSKFAPSDSSISSTFSQWRKGRDSNLIVKLMGLELLPSSPGKHKEPERIMNLAKPMYDIDSPRAKKPQFAAKELGVKRRSVDDILEALNFKGLLRNSSVNCRTINLPEFEVFSSKNGWIDERPPVVIMKPMCFPCLDLQEPIMPKIQGETLMKLRYSCGSAQEIIRNKAEKFSEEYKSAGVDYEEKDNKCIKKVGLIKGKASVNLHQEPLKKQATVRKTNDVETVTPIRRKGEEKKDAKSRHQEKLAISKMKRQKDRMVISENQSSCQQKTTSTSVLDHRKPERSDRKKNRQKILIEENQIYKGGNKTESIYKEEIDSTCDNNSVFPTVNSIQIRDYNDKKISLCDDSQSSYSEITLMSTTTITPPPSLDPRIVGSEEVSMYATIPQTPGARETTSKTSVSPSEHCNVNELDENHSFLPEVTLTITHENGVAVHLNADEQKTAHQPSCSKNTSPFRETDSQALGPDHTPRTKLKALLLSNPLFMTRIEELFDLQGDPGSVPFSSDRASDLDARVLIDCANEVMELKRSQLLQPYSLIYTAKPLDSISFDWLLEEICKGIESLRCYFRLVCNDFCSYDLYCLLDRDLSFKSGIWEIGWRSLFTPYEVEQVIDEIDKLVLGNLIEEVVSDFML